MTTRPTPAGRAQRRHPAGGRGGDQEHAGDPAGDRLDQPRPAVGAGQLVDEREQHRERDHLGQPRSTASPARQADREHPAGAAERDTTAAPGGRQPRAARGQPTAKPSATATATRASQRSPTNAGGRHRGGGRRRSATARVVTCISGRRRARASEGVRARAAVSQIPRTCDARHPAGGYGWPRPAPPSWRPTPAVADLLLLTPSTGGSAQVLPALGLLAHRVRVLPVEPSALLDAPDADVLLLDARRDLATARSTCRLLRATGLTVPLVLVLTEGGPDRGHRRVGRRGHPARGRLAGRGRGPAADRHGALGRGRPRTSPRRSPPGT